MIAQVGVSAGDAAAAASAALRSFSSCIAVNTAIMIFCMSSSRNLRARKRTAAPRNDERRHGRNATRRFSSKADGDGADDERRGGLAEDDGDEVERAEAGAAEVGGDGVGEAGAQAGDRHAS